MTDLAMTTTNLYHRAAFVVLLGGWTVIRTYYARRTRAQRDTIDRRATPRDKALIVLTGLTVLIPGIAWVWMGSLPGLALPFPNALRLFGALMAAVALALFLSTHRALGDNWSVTLEVQRKHALVEAGPYRYVRHPMYLAMLLFELGLGLLAADAILLLVSPLPFLLLVALRLSREEALMQDHFGAAYRGYAERTKRIIPWIY